MTNALEMKNICKYFPGVRANHNVNLTVRQGEVHALLGENGAGKSTLMNILYGLYAPTSGEVYINEEKVDITSPGKAIELGIGMVHQHFMLIPALSVIENVVLGMNDTKGQRLDLKAASKKLVALAEQYNMKVDPNAMVSDLTVGQQQRLEILKALYRGANLFIFDEPSAVLTPQEVEELFNMYKLLTSEGKTIIFITHKLNEVMAICDRCTVLRLGEVKATVNIEDTNREELAALMVGKKVDLEYDKKEMDPAEQSDVLVVKDLCSTKGNKAIKDINFTIKTGEILGFAGVDGNGQTDMVDCITGLLKTESGSVVINGKDMTNAKPQYVLDEGVSHIPADRLARGVVKSMQLTENVLIMNTRNPEMIKKNGIINWKAVENYTDGIIERYNVKTPSRFESIGHLSGGNQQKLVVGREVEKNPKLLISMLPSRGLDIGATHFIQETIVKHRDEGGAVLLVSTELDEILALSDRVAVMFEGQIMGIVPPTTPIHQISMMMAGMTWEDVQKEEANKVETEEERIRREKEEALYK